MVKDKATDEPKGICYIKFSKTSEAALAMEEMNGQTIGNHLRPLKVMVAHSRNQGSRRDANEEERLVRLFVVVPKHIGEKELRGHFSEFGNVQYASIVKDRVTKENKGYGYVKYDKMSEAAKAFENCDAMYKPVFAEPRPQNKEGGGDMGRMGGGMGGSDLNLHGEMGRHHSGGDNFAQGGMTRLTVISAPELNQNQLWRLFDLIPGLECCELRKDRKTSMGQSSRGVSTVAYRDSQSAAYACEKLNGFEYPPGQRLVVKPDIWAEGPMAPHRGPHVAAPGLLGPGSSRTPDISQLVETIAHASSLIQAAGLAPGGNAAPLLLGGAASPPSAPDTFDPYYCSVTLPPKQPLAPVDSEVAERLFIVCHGNPPPPIHTMKDVFGRFGNLIDIYMLNGKNFGYAKYACRDSAQKAIEEMHGQDIMGARLKVMKAEPHDKSDSARKRIRME